MAALRRARAARQRLEMSPGDPSASPVTDGLPLRRRRIGSRPRRRKQMQDGSMEGMGAGSVYVQTNEPDNHVIRFARADDGGLVEAGRHATGGKGDGIAHLTSQGSVVLTRDGRYVLVTNAASDDVSIFPVNEDGLGSAQMMATGPAPKSITEHDGVVYVLNTGAPSVTGFRIADGRLVSDRRFGAHAGDERRSRAGRVLTGRRHARRHRAGDRLDHVVRGRRRRSARGAAVPAVVRSHPVRVRVHEQRRVDRDRGVPSGEGRGGGFVVHRPRRIGDAGDRLGRQRPERDLLGRRDRR